VRGNSVHREPIKNREHNPINKRGDAHLLKVSDGRLDFVEIYTFGVRPWPDEPQGVVFGEATPLAIPTPVI